jgi:breast cancer 2 susceptibility protein
VLSQLRYRWDREWSGERSALRRIYERDESSKQPMTLVVMDVMIRKNEDEDETTTYLQLSDGWYLVKAKCDKTLAVAVTRKKLVPGMKVHVVGAKFMSGQSGGGGKDGVDPLQGYENALLEIYGNSTSLATWRAKLGFLNVLPRTTLRALTRHGGIISLLDLVVTKVFPLGFTDSMGGNLRNPWSESEEVKKEEEWKEKRVELRKKLRDEAKDKVKELEKIVEEVEEEIEARSGKKGGQGENRASSVTSDLSSM